MSVSSPMISTTSISGFDERSLDNPGAAGWKVRRDGGEFDQFTGATITPRAVVEAVHLALRYHALNGEILFSRAAEFESTDFRDSGS